MQTVDGAVNKRLFLLFDSHHVTFSLKILQILAAVGQLQFEVVQARLKNEYNVESIMEPMSYTLARWVDGGWDAVDKADADGKLFGIMIVQDRWQRPVLLFRNDWKAASLAQEETYLELKPWSQPPNFEE